MYKPFAALVLAAIFTLAATAQTIETNIVFNNSNAAIDNRYIVYSPNQKLALDNFEGKPDAYSDAVAITSSGFLFKAGFRSKAGKATLDIQVECSFDKQLSWMKERGKTNYVLGHEQHHFDISYISTLLFIKKLKQTRFTTGQYREQLQDVYNNAINDMQQLQNKYDEETKNGQLKDKQEESSKKIAEQIASLVEG